MKAYWIAPGPSGTTAELRETPTPEPTETATPEPEPSATPEPGRVFLAPFPLPWPLWILLP